jgi:hypothetical protein
MPWKLQEIEIEGAKVSLAVLDQAGNPVWVDDKGMETGQDVVRLRAQITEANNEAGKYRIRIKELEEAATPFEGLDAEKAKEALATVANYEDKQFVEAGKVEQLKQKAIDEVNKAWETKYGNLDADYKTKLVDFEARTGNQDRVIRNLMVRGAFEASQFIKESVAENYFPEVLYTMFGNAFEVVPAENGGDPVVVAKVNGEEIYSPSNPRVLASPEEAIEVLIRSHPNSKLMLKGSQASGSGAGGGAASGPRNALQTMKDQYTEAKTRGNTVAMVALKNAIFKEDPTFTG